MIKHHIVLLKIHGKKYRLIYQIYTNPKYVKDGKKIFEEVNKRYMEYAKNLEKTLKLSYEIILSYIYIYILIRASIHYALFENEYYLKARINLIKQSLKLFITNNN